MSVERVADGQLARRKGDAHHICYSQRSTGHTHTHTTAEHTIAEQTTHNAERATAQRRLIVKDEYKILILRVCACA